jgi:hypothetical protein
MVLGQWSWFERYTVACRDVLVGRRAVEKQRNLIAEEKAQGRDTKSSEDLLASFERTQVIFEDNLKRIRATSDLAANGRHLLSHRRAPTKPAPTLSRCRMRSL